jgi:hypothetical protein
MLQNRHLPIRLQLVCQRWFKLSRNYRKCQWSVMQRAQLQQPVELRAVINGVVITPPEVCAAAAFAPAIEFTQ